MKTTIAFIMMLALLCIGCSTPPEDVPVVNKTENIIPVNLPEEYKLITAQDNLQGYIDEKGVLNIEFNNSVNHNIDYQLRLRQDYQVELLNEYGEVINVGSLDDIPKMIEKDNL